MSYYLLCTKIRTEQKNLKFEINSVSLFSIHSFVLYGFSVFFFRCFFCCLYFTVIHSFIFSTFSWKIHDYLYINFFHGVFVMFLFWNAKCLWILSLIFFLFFFFFIIFSDFLLFICSSHNHSHSVVVIDSEIGLFWRQINNGNIFLPFVFCLTWMVLV